MKVEVHILGLVRSIEIERTGPTKFSVHGTEGAQIDALGSGSADILDHPQRTRIRGRGDSGRGGSAGPLRRDANFRPRFRIPGPGGVRHAAVFGGEGQQKVTAPMPGKVVRILVSEGATVEADQGLMVVEAMKMQNEIRASISGKVERIFVREGQAVAAGEPLVAIVLTRVSVAFRDSGLGLNRGIERRERAASEFGNFRQFSVRFDHLLSQEIGDLAPSRASAI